MLLMSVINRGKLDYFLYRPGENQPCVQKTVDYIAFFLNQCNENARMTRLKGPFSWCIYNFESVMVMRSIWIVDKHQFIWIICIFSLSVALPISTLLSMRKSSRISPIFMAWLSTHSKRNCFNTQHSWMSSIRNALQWQYQNKYASRC